MSQQPFRFAARYIAIGFFAASCLVSAQNSAGSGPLTTAPTTGGWKRVGDGSTQQPVDQAQEQPPAVAPDPQYPAANYPEPSQQAPMPQQNGNAPMSYPRQAPYQNNASIPAHLNVPAGTYLTVRVNQLLSSDRNQPGDAFSATLTQAAGGKWRGRRGAWSDDCRPRG